VRCVASGWDREAGRQTLARAFVVGNGSVLATGDRSGSLRELYVPSIFPGHQLLRRPARIGLLLDGALRWIDDSFEAKLGEGGDAPVVDLALVSEELEIEVWQETYVDVLLDAIVRRVQVTNRAERTRDLRIVFHHDLALAPGEPRETAQWDTESRALVHRAGRRVALIDLETVDGAGVPLARLASRASTEAAGAEALPGGVRLEGPGEVSGRCDSLAGAPLPLAPGASGLVTAWIVFASSLREARKKDAALRRGGVPQSLARTRGHWNLWVSQGSRDLPDLPEDVQDLYHRSLVLLRLHQEPGGSIGTGLEELPLDATALGVAQSAPRWCRHRDAAIAADALGRAGYHGATRRYLEHAARAAREIGVLPSATDADGAPVGPSGDPAGPALVLWTAARHFERERDVELAASFFREAVRPTADLLASSLDPATALPDSLDLWEEREGSHAWTAAVVRAGLLGGARLAAAFGDAPRARTWAGAADTIARSMTKHLFRSEWGRFASCLTRDGRTLRADARIDASLLWLGLLGDLEAEDARVRATVDAVKEALWVRTGVGGLARYERDAMGSVGTDLPDVPGSPSIAATLWLAQHGIRTARRTQDLDPARTLLLWCAARAEGWGVLPEKLHPYRGATTSPAPSLQAHAWLVLTVVDYAERLRHLRRCERCGAPAGTGREKRAAAVVDPLAPGLVAHT
jgi:GH15 family glucan-1,4-alpha-glucosidase